MSKRGVRRNQVAGAVLLVAALCAAPVAAQTGSVSGTITNAVSGGPVAGIHVELYDAVGAFTGFSSPASAANGSYTIANVLPGQYFARTWGLPTLIDKVYDGSAGVTCLDCNPPTVAGAVSFTVQANETRANTNLALLPSGRIAEDRTPNARTDSHATVFVDAPRQNTVATLPFTLSGWAVDQGASAGSGIDGMVVWAFPTNGTPATLVGVADYGSSRPDVGTSLGDPGFVNCGFSIRVNSANLPAAGTYDLTMFGRSTVTGDFTATRVVRVNVE